MAGLVRCGRRRNSAAFVLLALVFLRESVYFVAAGSAATDEKIRRINQVLTSLKPDHITALPPPPVENQSRGSVLPLFVPAILLAAGLTCSVGRRAQRAGIPEQE